VEWVVSAIHFHEWKRFPNQSPEAHRDRNAADVADVLSVSVHVQAQSGKSVQEIDRLWRKQLLFRVGKGLAKGKRVVNNRICHAGCLLV